MVWLSFASFLVDVKLTQYQAEKGPKTSRAQFFQQYFPNARHTTNDVSKRITKISLSKKKSMSMGQLHYVQIRARFLSELKVIYGYVKERKGTA